MNIAAAVSVRVPSSPRLAYFGVRTIVDFYLINLQEFNSGGPGRIGRNEESVHLQPAMAG